MSYPTVPYEPQQGPALVDLVNSAYAEWRSLPRAVGVKEELPPLTVAAWEEMLRDAKLDPEGIFSIWSEGRPVSVATVRVQSEGGQARLGYLATGPEHRRRGWASACLASALGYARRAGAHTVQPQRFVDSRWESACRFLEANGFLRPEPEKKDITMLMDVDQYEPRPVAVPEGYELANFRDGDEAAWVGLLRACFEGNFADSFFVDRFAGCPYDFDPQGWFFVEHNGEKVATQGLRIWRDPDDLEQITGAQVDWVCTLPEHRGKGIGTALLTACLNYGKLLRPRPLVLVTQPFRKPAIRLYERFGFRTVRELRVYTRAL